MKLAIEWKILFAADYDNTIAKFHIFDSSKRSNSTENSIFGQSKDFI